MADADYVLERLQVYAMKLRLYPTKAQAAKIDLFIRAVQTAYNITFHEVFCMNPDVLEERDGNLWPSFEKMADKKMWLDKLRKRNPIIKQAPAAALSTQHGLFREDAKKAWETGMHNLPVTKAKREDFHFYNSAHPRRSFLYQMKSYNLTFSNDNPNVVWIAVPKLGRIKARGFNYKIRFGENGHHSYLEAVAAKEVATDLTVRISKDRCGDYFASITFSSGDKNHPRFLYRTVTPPQARIPIGIDVGIRSLATLSDGTKYENKRFKNFHRKRLQTMNRKLSRRWGPANPAYREYSKEYRKMVRRENPQEGDPPLPRPEPSRGYQTIQQNKALLERRIARQRDTYYHQVTHEIVNRSSSIAIESLHVKNMLKNHKLAYSLSDAAMSDFLAKLTYKAAWHSIPLNEIGTFEPSSQLCSCCHYQYTALTLQDRAWTCPNCGTTHDRDVNAAKNILAIAQQNPVSETEHNKHSESSGAEIPAETSPPRRRQRKSMKEDIPAHSNLSIVLSKELSAQYYHARYVIIDSKTKHVIDNAQGFGYRSRANAKNCYLAKMKHSHSSATVSPHST